MYEAYFAESTNDYLHKLSISLKEIHKTFFWLELLKFENLISVDEYLLLNDEIIEIRKIVILTSYILHPTSYINTASPNKDF